MSELTRVATTADRLKEAMGLTGKKQVDLVRETGLNRGTISRYVSGEMEPRQKATHKLAVALGVSEMWLWGYDVPNTRTETQKKNDQLAQLVVRLRSDPDLFNVCMSLSELPEADFASIKQLVLSLGNK